MQIICFSWQAEYIIQHPQLLVPISSVHRGDRHEGCVYRAGMGVVSELHSSIVACYFKTVGPMCVWLGCELHEETAS